MTDRPIIFSAPMVRALLAGTKTQTRRLLLRSHPKFPDHNQIRTDVLAFDPARPAAWYWDGIYDRVGASYPIRYALGDRLWVREAYAKDDLIDTGARYVATDAISDLRRKYPSIHMPRWASRLTLTVTEVRVQRLQEISEDDAQAEGCLMDPEPDENGHRMPAEIAHERGGDVGWDSARDWYADLWDSLHGPGAWEVNPWVVAVSFTVAKGNIDQLANAEGGAG